MQGTRCTSTLLRCCRDLLPGHGTCRTGSAVPDIIAVPCRLRLCRATNATALVKLQEPQPDELGFVKHISVQEIGSNNCTVLRQVSPGGLPACHC